jgi:hypothetical protein
MTIDLTPIFSEHLAGNRGPDPADPNGRQQPNYGVRASLTGNTISLFLTFRAGSAYCCYESGCHLALAPDKRWHALRSRLEMADIPAPRQMEIRCTGVIEDGALFFDFSRPDPVRKGRYAFVPVAASRYETILTEASPPA